MTRPHASRRPRRLRLINPTSPLSTITMPQVIRKMTFSRRGLLMPLNLAICAAVVPDGWDVEILDENILDAPHTPDATGIDAVGLGAMTTQARRAYELADAYRALGVPVILGGIHPSALPDEALEHATIVCKGDAEGTLPRALRDLGAALDRLEEGIRGRGDGAGRLQSSIRGLPSPGVGTGEGGQVQRVYDWRDEPDAPIATPRKDLLEAKQYLVFNPIQTTRGCPHGCTFCTTPAIFGRRFRQRDIGAIVEEIRTAREQFGTKTFIFSDDDVAGNHRWARELFEELRGLNIRWASQCDILIARDKPLLEAMRASGCIGVILGLESPRAGTLQEAGKRYADAGRYLRDIRTIQSYGISIWGSFIFGFDSDDWHDCMQCVRFAQKARLALSCYPILTPYPGTEVFARYQAENRLVTKDWDKYNGSSVVFTPARMTPRELRFVQMAAFHEFYMLDSNLRRLGLLPLKRNSWLAGLAIDRGLRYYYSRRGRPLPRFRDLLAGDAERRIARSLGQAVVA